MHIDNDFENDDIQNSATDHLGHCEQLTNQEAVNTASFFMELNKDATFNELLLRDMATIKDMFNEFKQILCAVYEPNEVEALALMAASETTGLTKAYIKAFPEKELAESQIVMLNVILQRLQTAEPIQYILGHTEFYGLPFKVNPSVLIPRPETEELVEWTIAEVKNQKSKKNILDIGTGSGCIAICLKKSLTDAQVSAIDISAKALNTAQLNAELNDADINFFHADILKIKNSKVEHSKYDIIISNPPYVTMDDKMHMHNNVTGFEPHNALFVPKDDPLIYYKAIADYATENLVPNGLLFIEINENSGNETIELLTAKGFRNIKLRKDMSNKDRMIMASR